MDLGYIVLYFSGVEDAHGAIGWAGKYELICYFLEAGDGIAVLEYFGDEDAFGSG